METTQICPNCETVSSSTAYFCPNCGKKLREKPLSTTFTRQIGIYLISFFLPPFGLSTGFKYLKQKDSKEKTIGIVAILLTIASLAISIMIFGNFMNSLSKLYNGQLNSYQGIGF